MREAILPPPPSAPLAAWAVLYALWIRLLGMLARAAGVGAPAAHAPEPGLATRMTRPSLARTLLFLPAPAREGLCGGRDQRPTAVEGAIFAASVTEVLAEPS